LVKVIEPLFDKKFVKETFACMAGRGAHAAMYHVQKCARRAKRRWGKYYVLKCDISKFFPSVNHDILKKIIRKTISDYRVLNLIDIIIDSYEMASRGIPIGSLTSQLFANIYLNQLDHFMKEEMRVKYYARYMDDFIIIHNDKKYLHQLKAEIEEWVGLELDLNMNPKTGIFAERQGIDFCGYRIWPTHVLPRKSTMKRTKRRLRKFAAVYKDNHRILKHAADSIVSFLGYIKHCSGWQSTKSILSSIVFSGGNPGGGGGPVKKYTPDFKRKTLLTK
jgi:retron-type reverse transcriptase